MFNCSSSSSSTASCSYIIFAGLTADRIKKVSRVVQGSSGPPGVDADWWRRMTTCFDAASDQLCSALAAAGRLICTERTADGEMEGFTAARLIILDKRPGVRPIAVGEVFRRIISRAIMQIVETDVVGITVPHQLCVGVPSACEIGVHHITSRFAQDDVEGVLLVDASNAFNSVNRSAAIYNIARTCPAMSLIVGNTYREPIRLFVTGGGEVQSREGTCQGDPIAMAMYALSIMPLIHRLQELVPDAEQLWYADDDSALGRLRALRKYWRSISNLGPVYGYLPNPTKTVLVVKPEVEVEARDLFRDTGVSIRTDGAHCLGGAFGTVEFRREFLDQRVQGLTAQMNRCGEYATTHPHASYAVAVRSLVPRWKFISRAMECGPGVLAPIDSSVTDKLLPAVTGHHFSDDSPLRRLLSLPCRRGGIGLPIASVVAEHEHQRALRATEPMRDLLHRSRTEPQNIGASRDPRPGDDHPILAALALARTRAVAMRRERDRQASDLAAAVSRELSPPQQLLIEIAGEPGISSWLTADPMSRYGTVLNCNDFRDALCIRYDLDLRDTATTCVCGQPAVRDHMFVCPTGGYPGARHDNIRDLLAEVLVDVAQDVEKEPRLAAMHGEDLPGRQLNRQDEARADIRARGFWTRQQDAYFDVRVTHPKASVLSRSEVLGQLRSHERRKKAEYGRRIVNIERASFTPLVFTTQGQAAPECAKFLSTLATYLSRREASHRYPVLHPHQPVAGTHFILLTSVGRHLFPRVPGLISAASPVVFPGGVPADGWPMSCCHGEGAADTPAWHRVDSLPMVRCRMYVQCRYFTLLSVATVHFKTIDA